MNARDIRRLISLCTVLIALGISLYRSEMPMSPSQNMSETVSDTLAPQPETGEQVIVSRVVDGDTLAVLLGNETVTVRLIGMNAPESVDPRGADQCFGNEASVYMSSLAHGKIATLILDASQDDTDKYDRLLRYVEIDGIDIARQMILDGYALEYTYDDVYDRAIDYRNAEAEAQAAGRGLWAANTCHGEL